MKVNRKKILIVDDEEAICCSLQAVLEDEGYEVQSLFSGQEALLKFRSFDLILLDIWMPQMDGLECLLSMRKIDPQIPILVMSGHGTIETAVKATKLGAFDFIEKPLNLEKLLVVAQNALQMSQLKRENLELKEHLQTELPWVLGVSCAMQHIYEQVLKVAPTLGSVLITGENGTGKEVIARFVHAQSKRKNHPMIALNCAALAEDLIEAELFGYEKGAFTGAQSLKRGRFELAHQGTLFLDEIGDMSLKTQAKVLRVLQEKKFERLGGVESIEVDVRIIAATNQDLNQNIVMNKFREDLYYRLNVVRLHLPALRDRMEDFEELFTFFMQRMSKIHGISQKQVQKEVFEFLKKYSWPGNIREVKNFVERVVILSSDAAEPLSLSQCIEFFDDGQKESLGLSQNSKEPQAHEFRKSSKVLPMQIIPSTNKSQSQWGHELPKESTSSNALNSSVKDALGEFGTYLSKDFKTACRDFERAFILKVLEDHQGNVSKAAAKLGIERTNLHRKLRSLGLDT